MNLRCFLLREKIQERRAPLQLVLGSGESGARLSDLS